MKNEINNFNYEPSAKLKELFKRTKFKLDDFIPNKKEDIVIDGIYNEWLTTGTPSYNETYDKTITPMIQLLKNNPEKFLDDDDPKELLETLKKELATPTIL